MESQRTKNCAAPKLQPRSALIVEGFVLGTLTGMAFWNLGLLECRGYIEVLAGLVGAIIAGTRARILLWGLSGAIVALLLVVAYTPAMWVLTRGLVRQDPLHKASAVVVLGSRAFADGTLSAREQQRIVQGYSLLSRGYAPRLVLTRPAKPQVPWGDTIRHQMSNLQLHYPIDEVGPASDTHDEAKGVAALARQRGWSRIILVTDPWHMRRAAAAFEHEGLAVECSPCSETEFDWNLLRDQHDRVRCFRLWLHECIGYHVYRLRGWL